ncbi:MAG: YraN family protein [Caldilineaceae bacterium]|nr:YraN family protein [Caldilineaceae bacterium]
MLPPSKVPRSPRQRLGDRGEALAAQYLNAAGLTIITRNWRCAVGELDLVAQEIAPDFVSENPQAAWLVFVEVRTRRGTAFGTALQSITPQKAAKLREVSEHYVQQQAWHGPWRIDLVAVQMDAQGHLIAIDHVRHAVTG